ncbi:MAG: DUF192 domain-containing protein [Chloroflexota bacterium]
MSIEYRVLKKASDGTVILPRARWCADSWCHFKGLQWRASLPADEGVLFVYGNESVVNTSIHMMNVFFSIAVIWLDAGGTVVDKKLAKPWRLYYAPQKPAQYFIEANTDLLERVEIGDVIQFDEVASS